VHQAEQCNFESFRYTVGKQKPVSVGRTDLVKKILTLLAVGATVAFCGTALAQDFPGWRLKDACSAGDDACPRFEQFARGQVSGIWETLPPEARAACVAETEKVEKSYRLLYDCLANEMRQMMAGQVNKADDGKVVQLTPPAKASATAPTQTQ
jgi:hypothetical protein